MKIKNLASFAIAGLSLGWIAVDLDRAMAATINYDITVNNLDGSLVGNEFTGTFSFDDTAFSGSGSELLPVSDLSFEFQGTTFTEDDDISFNPEVEFFDGELLGLGYSTNVEFSFVPGFFSLSESFFSYDFGDGDAGAGDIIYTLDTDDPNPGVVPEPSIVIGLLTTVALGINSGIKNRKHKV